MSFIQNLRLTITRNTFQILFGVFIKNKPEKFLKLILVFKIEVFKIEIFYIQTDLHMVQK